MYFFVGMVPVFWYQAAEGVFHCACGCCVAVGLDCWQVDYVAFFEYFGDLYLFEYVVHGEHFCFWLVGDPFDVCQGLEVYFVFFHDRQPFVEVGAFPWVGYNGLVFDGEDVFVVVFF